MKTEKTYLQTMVFNQACTIYLTNNGYFKDGEMTKLEPTKLVTCLKNVLKQLPNIFAEYNEEKQCIVEMNCVVDSQTKIMLKDANGQYSYTAEGAKKMRKELKALNETKVTIHQRLVEGEFTLTSNEEEAFAGFVVPELVEELA